MLINLPYVHGGGNVLPRNGRLLYDLVCEKGYKRGLEIGTSNGYSTLWLALAFRKNGGKLITIEIDPLRAEEARANFRKAGLSEYIDCRTNDAFKEIPNLPKDFDFVFLDAGQHSRYTELLLPYVVRGGAITACGDPIKVQFKQ